MFLGIIAIALMSSCASVDVSTDYASNVDFTEYNTFAFYKPGVDKAEISDLDKRRILRAIESELKQKGMTKSEDPDLLVSIITDAEKNVNVYQNNFGYGWGWGWNPYFLGGPAYKNVNVYQNNFGYGWGWGWGWNPYFMGGPAYSNVSTSVDGILFIDLIDEESRELVWQGMGQAILSRDREEKIEKINFIVQEIMKEYPPQKEQKMNQ